MAVNTDRIYLVLVPTIRPLVAAAGRKRRRSFAAEKVTDGSVLFLGDSITQGGKWDELFPELSTLNRGINGDTTEDVLKRLDEALHKPIAVSLLIGTNDLHTYRRLKNPEGIVARAEEIVERIRAAAPEAQILINSMTPRTPLFAPRIRTLNARFADIAQRTGSTFVDLWPALANENGALRKEFTSDNLHLSPAGYAAWRDVLRPLLKPYATHHNTQDRD
jgi:lysophospholipase L1-like esterase